MKWCLMSSDVGWHIRDKLRPMPKHGSINLSVHGSQTDSSGRPPRLSHSSWTMRYPPFNALLLNCHGVHTFQRVVIELSRSTHLSACCCWTVTEYTPFSVLLLNCHGVHTFQRVVVELSPEYTPFSVLLLNCHRSTHPSALLLNCH